MICWWKNPRFETVRCSFVVISHEIHGAFNHPIWPQGVYINLSRYRLNFVWSQHWLINPREKQTEQGFANSLTLCHNKLSRVCILMCLDVSWCILMHLDNLKIHLNNGITSINKNQIYKDLSKPYIYYLSIGFAYVHRIKYPGCSKGNKSSCTAEFRPWQSVYKAVPTI